MHAPRTLSRTVALLFPLLAIAACGPKAAEAPADTTTAVAAAAPAPNDEVLRGRDLVIHHDCGGCHGGGADPAAKGWLAGVMSPLQEFQIGACSFANPKGKPCFITRPRNLTPDMETGLGQFTERQLFNALRYGLRPENTPDVDITSTTPGQGNFPATPHYLAVPMPWTAFRHMPDADLKAIAAYLHRGLAPVVNKVPDSEGPPDFWASAYTPDKIGTYPAAAFPTANEKGQ
jgi:mono/diheme cytochrome c family protein